MWSALLVTSFEIWADPGKSAQIVDHAVRQIAKRFSQREKAMANAVLRKVVAVLEAERSVSPGDVDLLARRFSHPRWRVERWVDAFGLNNAQCMAEWNQREPEVFFFPTSPNCPEDLGEATDWVPYRKWSGGDWSALSRELDAGTVYIQNPAARLATESIAKGFKTGRVLDLCAAPGGKSLRLDRNLGAGLDEIVAVDLPGPRFEQFEANLSRYGANRIRSLASDLFDLETDTLGEFEAVLLDAPCSNSGVIQKKPDVKWRFHESDFESVVGLQERMLEKAASFVALDGVLVYSTCSIDPEENAGVVDRFLASELGSQFERTDSHTSLPWETGHDGAGVCRLRRIA